MRVGKAIGIGVEALIALALVLALHGGAFQGTELLLRDFAPQPNRVYLELAPGVPTLPPLNGEQPDRIPRIASADVNVQGYAPPDSLVKLYVNEALKRELPVNRDGRFAAQVPVRGGNNHIVAQLLERVSDEPDPYPPTASFNVIREDSDASLTLYARTPHNGGEQIFGSTHPAAFIQACEGARPANGSLFAYVDEVGAFTFELARDRTLTLTPVMPGEPTQPCAELSRSDRVRGGEVVADAAVIRRKLTVRLAPNAPPQLQVEVLLPAKHTLAQWAREDAITSLELSELLFGIEGDQLPGPRGESAAELSMQQSVSTSLDSTNGAVIAATFDYPTTQLRIDPKFARDTPAFMTLPGDTLQVIAPPRIGMQHDVAPGAVENVDGQTRSTWNAPLPGNVGIDLTLNTGWQEPERNVDRADEAAARLATQANQQSPVPIINRIGELLPESLITLAWWALSAIPFLWSIRLLRQHGHAEVDRRAQSTAAMMLTLHVSVAVVWYLRWNVFEWQGAIEAIWDVKAADALMAVHRLAIYAFPPIVLAGALLASRMHAVLEQPVKSTTRWQLLRVLGVWPLSLAMVVAVSWVALAPPEWLAAWSPRYFVQQHAVAMALIALAWALGWVTVYWLLRTVLQRHVPLRLTLLASLAMLVLPMLPSVSQAGINFIQEALRQQGYSPFLLQRLQSLYSIVWAAIVVIAGVFTLRLLGRRLAAVAALKFTPTRAQHIALIAALVLVVFPVSWLLNGRVDAWTLDQLFNLIAQLLPVLLLLVLAAVAREHTHALQLDDLQRGLGALVFGFYLCGGTTNLLFVPIPMMLGAYLFKRVLVAADDTKQHQPARALANLIAFKEAQHWRHVFRRNAEKKYGEGELSRDAFEAGLKIADERVATARAALSTDEATLRGRIFGQGPGSSALDSALRALRVSLPLVVLYQAAQLNTLLQSQVYVLPILEIVAPLARWIAYWMAMAFVFGYFFHAIRGNDGPSKAWWFGLAIVVPTLAILVLNQDPLLGTTAGEGVLRIALFVGYLAVAFDLQVLKQAGHERRTLMLIYGAAPTLAYVSSLAALLGLSLGPAFKVGGCWLLRSFGFEVCTP